MRRFIAVLALSGLLAACGGDDGADEGADGGAESTETTTAAGGAETPDTAPAATDEAPAPTAADATTTSTVPTGSAEETGFDECLVGTWVMEQATLDQLVASAITFADISIPAGSYTVEFGADGTIAANATFTAAFAMSDVPVEADYVGTYEGTWSTGSGVLMISIDTQDAGVVEARQGGVSVPGESMSALLPVTPIAGGPYSCDGSTFELTLTGPTGPLVAVFQR